jgi:hypothetical protein
VKVSANDEGSGRGFEVYELICESDKSGKWWGTHNNAIDHYIKFEFPSCRICPSGYSLKAHNGSWSNGLFIRSWRFEGSNDDSEWTTLDTQRDCESISGNDKAAFFAVSTAQSFRFFRIFTSGPNSSGCHYFSMQQIELFGHLHRGWTA